MRYRILRAAAHLLNVTVYLRADGGSAARLPVRVSGTEANRVPILTITSSTGGWVR